ncbi:uncharacterized protein LOC136036664 [Artemia franciscana]|uniref:uncharacterized protein LOC136036664 n=1 Tax=Artemia franciscana TaxID=6661 RepID=UPI0032DB46DF
MVQDNESDNSLKAGSSDKEDVNEEVFSYIIIGHPLSSVNTEQDLGITIDNKLKFSTHTKKSAVGVNSTMGMIKCTLSTCLLKVIGLLYKGLVCHKLEGGMSLSSLYFIKHIKVLKDVQRYATKVILGTKEPSYPARLLKLKLLSLVYRKNIGDAILTNKLTRANTLPA